MAEFFSVTLAVLGWTAFGLAVLAGIALNMLGLFGNWLILLAVGVVAAVTGFDHFGGWTLPILVVLAGLGEVVETVAAGAGTARYGGGKGAMVAAIVGTIVGAIIGSPFMLIIGTIVGACIGAFVFAALYEISVSRKKLEAAARAGYGAALGKIAGMFAKTLVGFVMLFVAFLNY